MSPTLLMDSTIYRTMGTLNNPNVLEFMGHITKVLHEHLFSSNDFLNNISVKLFPRLNLDQLIVRIIR